MNQDPNYTTLRAVLDEAYAQAATGKGKERHAGGQPFEDQPMQVISDMLGSNDGMAYQAIKKIREGLSMPEPERTVHELLGAIVYVARIVVRVQRGMIVLPDTRSTVSVEPSEFGSVPMRTVENIDDLRQIDPDGKPVRVLGCKVGGVFVEDTSAVPDPRAIPALEKRCLNCVFGEMVPAPRVCHSCKGYSHWEPKS